MSNINSNTKGLLFAFFGFSFFAFADVSYKYVGQLHNPFEIGFWTQLFGLIILLATAAIFKLSLKTNHLKLQIIRSILLGTTYYSIIYAFQHMSLAEAYTIFYISPFLVSVMSVYMLGEKIGKHRLMCIIVSFIGVLIVLRPGFIPIELPTFAVLYCAFAFGLSNILSRKIGKNEPALAFTFYPTLLICIAFGCALLFQPYNHPSNFNFVLLLLGGGFESFGSLMVAQAFILIHAVTATKFSYFNLIWAVSLGYLIFGDVMDVWTVLGAVIIIGSGLYLAHREHLEGGREDNKVLDV